MEGNKHDSGKPRYDLLPADAIAAVALVMTVGAAKYDADNWAKGMHWRRLIGALKRHTAAFESGEDLDDETGLSHMAHAACCALFLAAYTMRRVGTDDRVMLPLPVMPEKSMQLIAAAKARRKPEEAGPLAPMPVYQPNAKSLLQAKDKAAGGRVNGFARNGHA